ncbi:ATP-NAD kinase family protein [Pseudorhodoferax aquiterrae]|uniref:ATP-NAD kinase family protein n=1 Tax=Pseudorhodoferax aquiterrae TaxID=747304 RepID=UPI001E2E3AD9|nr:ATP-NAD kinase family protein [Pseudorhodoferax aquiterrae]
MQDELEAPRQIANRGTAAACKAAAHPGHAPARPRRIGLLVNPIAGMGGRVGLKGTDGAQVLQEARRRGAQPIAGTRTLLALQRLAATSRPFSLVTAAGALGEQAVQAAGLRARVVYRPTPGASGPVTTQEAVRAFMRASVDLVLFAGGDGTARDVMGAVDPQVPILGVPTGVKMYSAVFGTSPANAGLLAARFVDAHPTVCLRDAEVMDADEAAIREDRISVQLFGYATSLYARALAQNAKSGTRDAADVALQAACHQMARSLRPGALYLFGPGTTTRRVLAALGLPATLLGVDAVLDGALVGKDLHEDALLALMQGRETHLVLGVLGGHGTLLGRGNQQLSPQVLRQVARDHIHVLGSVEKLATLNGASLHVDTGDAELDACLLGYLPVRTGADRSVLLRVR